MLLACESESPVEPSVQAKRARDGPLHRWYVASMEGRPKSPQDQLQEIEKLVTDAARLLDQALFALGTVAARLKDEADGQPES